MTELLDYDHGYECVTCGYEWETEEIAREVKDACGNELKTGFVAWMVTGLKLKGCIGSAQERHLVGGVRIFNHQIVHAIHMNTSLYAYGMCLMSRENVM